MEARALEIVYGAVQALNEQIENPDERIPLAPESTLLGKDAHLDSLSLATLLLFAEQRIEDTFGVRLVLSDERALSIATSPFVTIESFARHIERLLKQSGQA